MGSPPQGIERRKLKRYFKRIDARFQAGTIHAQGHIKNLSQEGLFIRSHILPNPGEEIVVNFTSPEGRKIEVTGTVRWTTAQLPPEEADAPPGFGVLLHHVDDAYLRFFEALLLS